jgi:hypothetical protein
MDIDISAEKAPLKAQLRVGGGFPITWVLYDYASTGGSWTRSHVGSGQGSAWVDIPTADAAALKDHVLTWAVAAVDFDEDALEVDVVVTIKGSDPASPGAERKGRWSVSKSQPRAFISVRIVK